MAGLVPESLKSLQTPVCEKAFGNTIPVPLIGDILANILAVWCMKLEGDDLQRARSRQ